MGFRNLVQSILHIVSASTGKDAIIIKAGATSNGYGSATGQFFSGSADEANPAEMTAISDGDTASSNASFYVQSPSKTSQNGNGRSFLQLFAQTSSAGSSGVLYGASVQLVANQIYLKQDSGNNPSNAVVYLNGNDIRAFQSIADKVRTNITNFASGVTARTPTSTWPCWVTPIGNDLAFLQVQINCATAIASGGNIFGVPSAFYPKQYQEVHIQGAVTPASGQIPTVEISPTDGVGRIYQGSIPANVNVIICGVYSLT